MGKRIAIAVVIAILAVSCTTTDEDAFRTAMISMINRESSFTVHFGGY